MKIRSITCFCNPGWPLDETRLRHAADFLAEAKAACEAAGYEVQTTRLATIPFPRLLRGEVEQTPRLAAEMGRLLPQIGAAYAALGPALPEMPTSYEVLPEAVAAAENVFFSGVMADSRRGLSLEAVHACAEVIVRLAPLTPDGFANLRFAALANVPPGAPFFPAAYWEADEPAFAIATEAADLAVEAFGVRETSDGGPRTVEEGRKRLVASLEAHGRRLTALAGTLACRFLGIDFSLAPFPDDRLSLGAAVEALGVPQIGLHGSLAAAAILTEAVERARFPHAGFSGFMQPVLEDSVLARRAAEGTLTVKDALLYSAVCGTGLDTVPLPGDVRPGQVAALLLDLAALALRLDKPLTARLMPIPGKRAGDPTGFDFAFFANSRVMALQSEPLTGPLGGGGRLALSASRKRRRAV